MHELHETHRRREAVPLLRIPCYRDDGIALEVIIHPEQWPRLEPFVIPDEEV